MHADERRYIIFNGGLGFYILDILIMVGWVEQSETRLLQDFNVLVFVPLTNLSTKQHHPVHPIILVILIQTFNIYYHLKYSNDCRLV